MGGETKTEKQSLGSWIRFLEAQVESRNAELAMLRAELEEKSQVNKELILTLERDSQHISETATALEAATTVIKAHEEKIASQADTIASLESARIELSQQLYAVSQKPPPKRPKHLVALLAGLILGATPFATKMILSPALSEVFTRTGSDGQKETVKERTIAVGQELKARPLETPSPTVAATASPEKPGDESALAMPAEQELPPSSETWKTVMSELRQSAFGVAPNIPFDTSPAYADNSNPTVITRAQFRDIVTSSLATTLPSRTADGILLYEFEGEEMNGAQFAEETKEANLPVAPLCNPWNKDPAFFRRLTIVVSNSNAAVNCLRQLTTSQWYKNHWEELAVVVVKNRPRHSYSHFEEKKFFTFQEWDPKWITRMTAPVENESTDPAEQRTTRLARLARILTKSSDVRVQVPIRQAGKIAHLNFGNLTIIPSEISAGSLKVSRISLQTGMPFGRMVSQPITTGARAVIINGAEQTLSIENNTR